MAAIKSKMADGGVGSYQKLKAKYLTSTWKKFGAFVRCVHINAKFDLKLPYYIFIALFYHIFN